MNMKETADSLAGYLYSHFIMRDLAYLGSGTAFLFVVFQLLEKEIFTRNVTTIIFFGAAYFTGFFMMQILIYFGFIRMAPKKGFEGLTENDDDNWTLSVQQLYTYAHPAALIAIERIIYLKHIAATFGSAAFFSASFALIHALVSWKSLPLHYWTIGVGIALFLFCIKMNRVMCDLQFHDTKLLKSKCSPHTVKGQCETDG